MTQTAIHSLNRPRTLTHLPRHLTHSATPYFFSAADKAELKKLLKFPYRYLFEIRPFHYLRTSLEKHKHRKLEFALSISTKTAHDLPIADIVTKSLGERFSLNTEALLPIHTCVQEGLSNAIIHGNLDIHRPVDNVESFTAFYDEMEQKLKSEHYAEKRIDIAASEKDHYLTIAISDEGAGFALPLANIPEPETKDNALSGRGLRLMQEMTDRIWMEHGDTHTLNMGFKL